MNPSAPAPGGGFLGPLIIDFVKGKDSRFVAFHALQAIFGHLGFMLVMPVGLVVMMVATFGLAATH
jgi:uncharacterized membrane protein